MRLGMGRTAARQRVRLARRCMGLPALAEAVSTMAIGFESACLLVRYVSPRTERAWIERAQKRTYKLLGHELRAVEQNARLLGREGADLWPPNDEEMAEHEELERAVVSGALIEQVMNESKKAAAEAADTADEAEIRIDEAGADEAGADEARADDAAADDAAAEASSSDDPIRISTEAEGLDPDLRELADRIGEAMVAKRRRRRKGETRLRWRAHPSKPGCTAPPVRSTGASGARSR